MARWLARNAKGIVPHQTDSPQEQDGFEPLVPLERANRCRPHPLTGPALCLTPGLEPIEVFDTPDLKEATALLTCRYRAIRRASFENEQ